MWCSFCSWQGKCIAWRKDWHIDGSFEPSFVRTLLSIYHIVDRSGSLGTSLADNRLLIFRGGTPRSRTVRVTVSGIGHNGAMYRGCPTCRISERRGCGHAYVITEWLFRLKLMVKDPSGELEVTAWKTAKQILGMELDDFVVVHVRAESDAVLRRLVGSHLFLSLSRQKSERGYYARVERAESVTRKQFFAENLKIDADTKSMEAPRTPERMVVPTFSLAAGVTSQVEMASILTGREGDTWS
ncbi:hypothetical protein R1sor_024843 [Riccia sorocarpa]|uniref:Replication protein A OB domain-containing protein n=1 Tax=Riccia sorocarpa TaxID=122646 RepID=A0ABD3GRL4_9MARC